DPGRLGAVHGVLPLDAGAEHAGARGTGKAPEEAAVPRAALPSLARGTAEDDVRSLGRELPAHAEGADLVRVGDGDRPALPQQRLSRSRQPARLGAVEPGRRLARDLHDAAVVVEPAVPLAA